MKCGHFVDALKLFAAKGIQAAAAMLLLLKVLYPFNSASYRPEKINLKSPGRLGRAGSSPAPGTTFMSPTHHTYK